MANEGSLYEQIEEYEANHYEVAKLKPLDKEFIKGMAWMHDQVAQYDPIICTGVADFDKIAEGVFESIKEDLLTYLIASVDEMLYSIMDNDEDYWEEDDE